MFTSFKLPAPAVLDELMIESFGTGTAKLLSSEVSILPFILLKREERNNCFKSYKETNGSCQATPLRSHLVHVR